MRLDFRLCVLLLIAGALAAPASGLDAGEEQADQLGGLSYNDAYDHMSLRVDVFVRDQDGNPVSGLQREQFRLFQDGTEVPISSFAAFSPVEADGHGAKPVAVESPEIGDVNGQASRNEARPIYLMLFIDNQKLRFSDRNRVLRSLQAFVSSNLGSRTQLMIVCRGQSIEIAQAFTNDPDALIDTLRRLRMSETFLDERDKEREDIQKELQRVEKSLRRATQGQNRELSDLFTSIRDFAIEEERSLEETLLAIRSATAALTGITERKYLVYLSNGLPLSPGAEMLHQFSQLDKRSNRASSAFVYNKKKRYDALAAAANAQDITIHTIDATGSYKRYAQLGDSDSRISTERVVVARENQQAPLKLLAKETGGLSVVNTDDFATGLNRIRSALQTYYSIGHDLDVSAKDTVHFVRVEIDGAEGYEALYKSTFVEKSILSRVQDLVTSGLFFDESENRLGIEVTTDAQEQVTESQWRLPVNVRLPVRSLAMIRGGDGDEGDGDEYIGRAVLFIAMRDLQGRSTDMQRQPHTFRLTAEEYERRKDDHHLIVRQLLLGSGHHRIVVGILDEVTHQVSTQILQIATDPSTASKARN